MHGTGQFSAINALGGGGAVITAEGRRLDAEALWSMVEARDVTAIAIVGDAFAKPMLAALEAQPERWDLGRCRLIVSSGVLWSPAVKQALLRFLPHAVLMDSFGSSEAVGFGVELTTRETSVQLGRFRIGPSCNVFTPDGREVAPGSGERGYVARADPFRSATTRTRRRRPRPSGRSAACVPRRLVHGGRRRDPRAPGAGLGVHQHGGREGPPRGGGGDPQAPSGGRRRHGGRGARREVGGKP